MISDIVCSVCRDKFRQADEIFTTNCGHVYHKICMQGWQQQTQNCPQCRKYNPQTHQLFMNFEESSENEPDDGEGAVGGHVAPRPINEEDVTEISLLEAQLDESKRNFMLLQIQFSEKDDEIYALKLDAQHYVEELSVLQNKLDETERNVVALQMQLDTNVTNNDNTTTAVGKEIVADEKIKYLEQKLKQVTEHLEKEIRNNTKLNEKKNDNNESTKYSHKKQQKPKISTVQQSSIFKRSQDPSLDSIAGASVVLSGLPKNDKQTKETLKQIALKVSNIMDLSITENDIVDTFILQSDYSAPNKRKKKHQSMVIQFKTLELKNIFMASKEKLKSYATTCNFKITEFVSAQVNILYHYAEILSNTYEEIYCQNNEVYVRLTKTSEPIKIKDKKHVDVLKGNSEFDLSQFI